jgi:hypothetical protein
MSTFFVAGLDYYMFIYTHCWELMNSVGSHGSSSLPFVMKVMVCHSVSDSHEVMTALIVVLPLIVVVEISLQLHGSFCSWVLYIFLLQNCSFNAILFQKEMVIFESSVKALQTIVSLPRPFLALCHQNSSGIQLCSSAAHGTLSHFPRLF